MVFKLASDVRETSLTGGTGDQVLTGTAFDASYFRFADRYANADTFFYCMKQGALREVGLGTRVASGDKITRTQVYRSTNADALVNFVNGQTIDIFVTNIAPSDLDANGLALLRGVLLAAKSGANSDITGLTNLTGGATFPNNGVGITLSSGGSIYDASGNGTVIRGTSDAVLLFNAAASLQLARFSSTGIDLRSVPTIAGGNLLMQMARGASGRFQFADATGVGLIQWGSAVLVADGAVNFGAAFPNHCQQVLAAPLGAPATSTLIAITTTGYTTSKFDAYPRLTTGGTPSFFGGAFSYLAIGD